MRRRSYQLVILDSIIAVLFGLLVGLVVFGVGSTLFAAPAQTGGMRMPDDVYATLAAVVKKYPHTGTDDERRDAMLKVVQTLRARHDKRWVWKTEHKNLDAPSKDGLGYVADGVINHGQLTVMYIFDTINGGTRQPNAPPMFSEPARQAYVLAPAPKDWLAGDVPPPPPVYEVKELLDQISDLTVKNNVLTANLGTVTGERDQSRADYIAVKTELDALKSRPAPTCRANINLGAFRIPIPCTVVQP